MNKDYKTIEVLTTNKSKHYRRGTTNFPIVSHDDPTSTKLDTNGSNVTLDSMGKAMAKLKGQPCIKTEPWPELKNKIESQESEFDTDKFLKELTGNRRKYYGIKRRE